MGVYLSVLAAIITYKVLRLIVVAFAQTYLPKLWSKWVS